MAVFFAQPVGKLLKGGLHCHTTRSDGKGSPEEVIRMHAENGYDFLALTDHRYYNYVNYAPETGITIIPGMEMDGGITTGEQAEALLQEYVADMIGVGRAILQDSNWVFANM